MCRMFDGERMNRLQKEDLYLWHWLNSEDLGSNQNNLHDNLYQIPCNSMNEVMKMTLTKDSSSLTDTFFSREVVKLFHHFVLTWFLLRRCKSRP